MDRRSRGNDELEIGSRAFPSKIEGSLPSNHADWNELKAHRIDTPLGSMLAIGDDQALFFLQFVDQIDLEQEADSVAKKMKVPIRVGQSDSAKRIEKELEEYFKGWIREFKTPLFPIGSPFQKKVWKELETIPFGQTRSYGEISNGIGNRLACRAVGLANGANQIAIAIPCHRVINRNGEIGGYRGGIQRKEWLLNHERRK